MNVRREEPETWTLQAPTCSIRRLRTCDALARFGGRVRARNLRLRETRQAPVARELSRPREETAAEAIRRIDALCPWLVGAERCVSRRQGG